MWCAKVVVPAKAGIHPSSDEAADEWVLAVAGMLLGFLLKGMLVGIIIALPTGPVGVLCIRRTILHGRLAGLVSGLGAASADAVFGIIAAFGLSFVSRLLLQYQDWLRLGGGGFLLYIGISAFA